MSVNRTRKFELPRWDELNKDQDAALALPKEGSHLIIGGPGTGKSVVCLLRMRRLIRDEHESRVLVFNQMLNQSNQHLLGQNSGELVTWMTWFKISILKTFAPNLADKYLSEFSKEDWEFVLNKVTEWKIKKPRKSQEHRFFIIDEGQDMPEHFYEILRTIGFDNFYVAADQNQQLTDNHISRENLEIALGLETDETLELKTNYRNTHPIALLAQHFYPDDPASPKPDLPEPQPSNQTPELWTYDNPNSRSLAQLAATILQLSDRNPQKLIGIITPTHKERTKFIDALNAANPNLDYDKPPIQTYPPDKRTDAINFGEGGIMVLCAASCKGLEFDFVFLADIDKHWPTNDERALKSKFYVMSSRAKEQLFLLRTGYINQAVDKLLPPPDSTILLRN